MQHKANKLKPITASVSLEDVKEVEQK